MSTELRASAEIRQAVKRALSPPTLPRRLTLTVQEAADALGVSYITVHRLIHDGSLPVVPRLRINLIPVAALERWVAQASAVSSGP